jgi:hypothetical protein
MSFFIGQERLIAQIAFALGVGCLLWLAVLQVITIRQRRSYRRLMRGPGGQNLEQVLVGYAKELDQIRQSLISLKATADDLDRRLRRCIQRVEMVRFNPFQDTVADQSFAVALLDDGGDGFVLSTLHGRDLTRVYGKPVRGKQSSYPLSPEEQEAIGKASALQKRGRQPPQSPPPKTEGE